MAIKIYTDKGLIGKDKYIKNAKAYFNVNIQSSELTQLDKEIINKIDGSTFIDSKTISTPFGVTSVFNISSGAKAVICALHFPDKIIDLISCGENALKVLFELIDGTDIQVFLDHTAFSYGGIGDKPRFLINNSEDEVDISGLRTEVDKYSDWGEK